MCSLGAPRLLPGETCSADLVLFSEATAGMDELDPELSYPGSSYPASLFLSAARRAAARLTALAFLRAMRGTSSLELERVKLAEAALTLEAEETLGSEALLEGSG